MGADEPPQHLFLLALRHHLRRRKPDRRASATSTVQERRVRGWCMVGTRREIIDWVATCILPHEAWVRRWLIAHGCDADLADDLLQDAYCRFAELESADHIGAPRAYFLATVRNLHRARLRRQKVIRFEALTDMVSDDIMDELEDPERVVDARRQLALVADVLAALPARCREIFRLRRVEGLSQKEIAHRMRVSEGVVENDAAKAVRHLLAVLRADGEGLGDGAIVRRRA